MAFDKRSGFFFVSATGDGSIYRGKLGDTATPVPVFIPGAAGQSATGLKVQRGKLYAAGASTGTIKVYDVDSGTLLATFDTKGGDSSPTFINDLDVTKRGDVYATDSKRPAIYHLTAEEIAAGTPAPKPIDPDDVISTSPEIPFNAAPAAFNLNGIVVDNDRGDDEGRHHGDRHRHHGDRRRDELIVVDSDTGQLFRVKVGKHGNDARKIRELKVKGGPFKGGDGLLIDRGRLIVVQGSADGFPNGVVDFIELRHDGRNGRLDDQRTDASFQGPSTIARARDRYLVVNPGLRDQHAAVHGDRAGALATPRSSIRAPSPGATPSRRWSPASSPRVEDAGIVSGGLRLKDHDQLPEHDDSRRRRQ